ncbi:MAG TPA: P27 family phage terminase small subunit [Ensifer sp.]|nr:P27 family phage terminase small subunit [Ensifer sp.]
MAKKPKVPAHLEPETQRWVRQILDEFELESHHFRQLILTAQAWDRAEQARKIIAAEGLTVLDRYGTAKAHPAVAIERDSRTAFHRGIRELALDGENPSESRPPRTADYGSRR